MVLHEATIRAFFPLYCTGRGLSRCLLDLGDHFRSARFGFEYWCLGAAPGEERGYQRVPWSPMWGRLGFKLPGGELRLRRRLERAYLDAIEPGDIAYLWPGSSVELHAELRALGITTVLEMVNTAAYTSRHVLDAAYRRWGLETQHKIDDAFVAEEQMRLALTDYVLSPSPAVSESLVSAGVLPERILPTTYAWDPRVFRPPVRREEVRDAPPVFLCVALGSVRKGYPDLLQHWADAGIEGRLRLVGPIDEDVRMACATHLARPDVEVLPYTEDLSAEFGAADAFVLASHEEGSPLVAYMALAAGLPILASPAVASGIMENEVHGLVRAPSDTAGWVEGLRRLAGDRGARLRMGAAGRAHAQLFTWDAVARQRRLVFESLHGRPRASAARARAATATA